MLQWLVLALLLVPGVQACSQAASATIEMDFPKPEGCARGKPEGCPSLPEADLPLVVDGIFTWSWELDPACSQGTPSPAPIYVTFKGNARHNHGWLDIKADPSEIVIPVEQQYDFTDDDVDLANARFRSHESYPLRVTISLVGEPSDIALQRMQSAGGVAELLLKASSGGTSAFEPIFEVEQFLLDGRAVEPQSNEDQGIPSPSVALALAAVGLAAALRRRG